MTSRFTSPYPPYDPTDKTSFSYETVVKRWPIIITGVVDVLHKACHELSLQVQTIVHELGSDEAGSSLDRKDELTTKKAALQLKIAEGTAAIEKVSKLKYEMARDKALEKLPQDGEPGIEGYNSELAALEAEGRHTWFTAPWLYAECYLYRLLRSYMLQTTSWKTFDPFLDQKVKTFQHSGKSILKIATTMHELDASSGNAQFDDSKLKVLFNEMIQMCLWGNATDLSLLTHLTQDDIQHLQTVGKDAQAERAKFILKDDEEAVWSYIQTLTDGRVDFVLDNSGFELFTDLVFADFLVSHTPYISKVVFHPKLFPWFVSDVTPPDFKATFSILSDPAFFPAEALEAAGSIPHLKEMANRWNGYLESGVFSSSVPVDTPMGGDHMNRSASKAAEFWTTQYPYWDLKLHAPSLFEQLKDSSLVVYKGDLNYRKLTGDVRWPAWTSFAEALGPLAGSFPILSLRTNKADVVVGVERETAERLDASGEKWRVDGRYALVSFLPRSS